MAVTRVEPGNAEVHHEAGGSSEVAPRVLVGEESRETEDSRVAVSPNQQVDESGMTRSAAMKRRRR